MNDTTGNSSAEPRAEGQALASGSGRVLWFGCARGVWGQTEVGHGFHLPGGKDRGLGRRHGEDQNPWGLTVDAGLAPLTDGRTKTERRYGGEEAPQGQALLHHLHGWTALSFWDRTGDSRGNSNSTFLFDATLSFDEALSAAQENFPELFARFNFKVVPFGGDAKARDADATSPQPQAPGEALITESPHAK